MKKIIGIFMCMLFLGLSYAISEPENNITKAVDTPIIYPIDYDFIKEITENLSEIINNPYIYPDGVLAKGRFFGSDGERNAAQYIAEKMSNTSLYDPTPSSDGSYLEQIEDIYNWKDILKLPQKHIFLYKKFIGVNGELTKLLEVNERYLNVKKSENVTMVDCYISPRWNWRKEKEWSNKNKLNKDYTFNNVKLIDAKDYTCTDSFLKDVEFKIGLKKVKFSEENISFINNHQISVILQIKPKLKEAFANYYNFSFDNMTWRKPKTWPDFLSKIDDVPNGFIFIEECPINNPNIEELPYLESFEDYNEMYWWTYMVRTIYRELRMECWYKAYQKNFLLLKYNKCKGLIWYDYLDDSFDTGFMGTYLPVIYINGSIGEEIYNDTENYTVSYHLKQQWNNSIESYNVIGQINGTNPDKTAIIGCLYDSQWCQGTTDSAIGVGIMLAIAKYFVQNDITPKYNLKFVAYGGEETGMRGAFHYDFTHANETIVAVIDLNQFGFQQQDIATTFNMVTNKICGLEKKLDYLALHVNYLDRTPANVDDITTFSTPMGSLSDDWVFAISRITRPLYRGNLETTLFLRDTGWYRHHRDGMNHTQGDSFEYYMDDDVNLTAELIWNITKYFTVNPNCWFKEINHELWDSPSDNNNIPDYLNLSYKIKTCMPDDHVTVKAFLFNNLMLPQYSRKDYVTALNSEIDHYINFSLPATAPLGIYHLRVYLYNSTGEVKNHFWCKLDNVLHPIRDGCFANDTYIETGIYMGGCNDAITYSSQPSSSTQSMSAGTSYSYTTNASDPNSDQVYYQFEWTTESQESEYSSWYGPYSSDAQCSVPHVWITSGAKQVRVRARDEWHSPCGWSNWSDPLNVTVVPGCGIEVSTNNILVNENLEFKGLNFDLKSSGPAPSWEWKFGNGNTSTDQNTSQAYNSPGVYTVNLTLSNDTAEVYCERFINVLNISADFSVSQDNSKSNETLNFINQSKGLNGIVNWTWNFGDGNLSYEENPSHSYATDGIYNVTLNVSDGSNVSSSFQLVYIDSVPPTVSTVFYSTEHPLCRSTPETYYPDPVGYGCEATINADFFGNISTIETAKVNVTYPDATTGNFTMIQNSSFPHEYEYVFDNTWNIGDYIYDTWVVDKAGNSNKSQYYLFSVEHLFGYTPLTTLNQSIEDRISGSSFMVYANATAENISAYIQTNLSTPPKTKCMIYRTNDSALIGTTEELTPNTGEDPDWTVFNFSEPKPTLVKDTEYILACWSNDSCYLYYDNVTDDKGMYNDSLTYGSSPDPINWTSNETREYSIFCRYSTIPEISNVSDSPGNLGMGSNVTISAEIESFGCAMDLVIVNITNPDDFSWNYTMTDVGNDTYEFVFDENWLIGQYNYSIWAFNEFDKCGNSTGHFFNVSSNATISICTIKDAYGSNETINLTDPPGDSSSIGWELLDGDNVLRIWNKYDSYYFDTDSGIQLTNHYDEYWSHNVMMLGYYNNDEWNLIYRTDELTGFNKNIESDNETYVNATLWKDLTYQGYDFRLAVRYYLGIGDNELTVIPYIKNLGQENIPYSLGFGWEMKDIKIDMTETGDYIDVNQTMYYLNQTLNIIYTDLSESEFHLMENITDSNTKSLYLKWNGSLNYKLQVKSRDGQYNAPVTLFLKIGTLDSGQEKYTKMYWYDADQATYYFDTYSGGETWANNPGYMVDGSTSNFASTTSDGDIELCTSNNCSGNDLGTISKVELRVHGYYSGNQRDIILRPVFVGSTDGLDYPYVSGSTARWSDWFDITNDPFAPQSWSWSDVVNLDCDVEMDMGMLQSTVYASKVEIRVMYTPNSPPGISNPYPSNCSTNISLTPILNITVSDPEGDSMNITWLSNSSGSWQVFGTNSSVNNGTYHQIFSNVTENGKWWYWKVNVTDGTDYAESSVYKFYSGCQSKIENTGSTNISGYLCIQIHYYNQTTQNWTIVGEPINETMPRKIIAGGQLGLDTIFNGIINTDDLSEIGNGSYRVYVAFRDLIGTALVTDDETELVATYEFTITFD